MTGWCRATSTTPWTEWKPAKCTPKGVRGTGRLTSTGCILTRPPPWFCPAPGDPKRHKHHSFFRCFGRAKDQLCTRILESDHIKLHADFHRFEEGKWAPKRGMTAIDIVDAHGPDAVIDALRRFYQSKPEYERLLELFELAVKTTGRK